MAKAFSIVGMVVSGLIALLCLVDLLLSAVGLFAWAPFWGANWMFDIVMILCSGGLGYFSWTVWREQL